MVYPCCEFIDGKNLIIIKSNVASLAVVIGMVVVLCDFVAIDFMPQLIIGYAGCIIVSKCILKITYIVV